MATHPPANEDAPRHVFNMRCTAREYQWVQATARRYGVPVTTIMNWSLLHFAANPPTLPLPPLPEGQD